jgi:sugar porter (SP) family MFS transporter
MIVALGGFLMGFDASVISGVVKFIEPEFGLSKLELGWAVSSLTLTSTLAMMLAGPLSNRFGRRLILRWAAVLYAISAVGSALAPDFFMLVMARMLGGLGVGASLIIAPVYIAEISQPHLRGRMVSFNQLNIVLGISVAFFTNYLILKWGNSDAPLAETLMFDTYNWRWMLGLETLPAIVYFIALFAVPRSPRWLFLKKREKEAILVLSRITSQSKVEEVAMGIQESLSSRKTKAGISFMELFRPAIRLVLIIGITVAVLQQITGINAIFFYAPMIFEQTGIGADASFSQAVLVGITNLIFTILAMLFIDRFGRKLLLMIGLSGIFISMFLLSYGFHQATYEINEKSLVELAAVMEVKKLEPLKDVVFNSDLEFKAAVSDLLGMTAFAKHEGELLKAAGNIDALLILIGILGFVASFAISIGPVMWVLFSEIFPNYIRGLAISFVGFINSGISFLVQLIFPWELANLGSALTFLLYGVFALIGLTFLAARLPETKNKSLEELESLLIK